MAAHSTTFMVGSEDGMGLHPVVLIQGHNPSRSLCSFLTRACPCQPRLPLIFQALLFCYACRAAALKSVAEVLYGFGISPTVLGYS